jgi:hypothetical protein
MCNKGWSLFSPGNDKLASLCDHEWSPRENATWIQVDRLGEAVRFQYEVPVPWSWNGPSSLRWLTDNRLAFIAGPEGMPCVLDLDPFGFGCLRDGKPNDALEVFEDGSRVVVWSRPTNQWDPEECAADVASCPDTWRIYDVECIRVGHACTPVLEVAMEYAMWFTHPIPAPNGEAIAFVHGLPDSSEVGIVSAQDGEVTHLGVLGGYFSFVDWCPDSTCFLVAPGNGHPYARSYFIYLDGHQEPLDIADPMAILEIPQR